MAKKEFSSGVSLSIRRKEIRLANGGALTCERKGALPFAQGNEREGGIEQRRRRPLQRHRSY